jgi:hypothetical protein
MGNVEFSEVYKDLTLLEKNSADKSELNVSGKAFHIHLL